MINNFKLYYSLNNLISNDTLPNLIKDYSKDSLKEYKTELWYDNKIYGTIIFILEIKYDLSMNYYTFGIIKLVLENNIYIESTFSNKGTKIDCLTDKLNIKSNIYMVNNKIIDSRININIDFIIKDNNTFGIIALGE